MQRVALRITLVACLICVKVSTGQTPLVRQWGGNELTIEAGASSLSFSSDSRYLAWHSSSSAVFDLANRRLVNSWPKSVVIGNNEFPSYLTKVWFLDELGEVLVYYYDYPAPQLEVWSEPSHRRIRCGDGAESTGAISRYWTTISRDRRFLVSIDQSTLKIIDLQTLKSIRRVELPFRFSTSKALAFDGKYLAFLGKLGIEVWDTTDGVLAWTGPTENQIIQEIEFSVDGQTLAVAGKSKVELWNTKTRTKTYETASTPNDRIALADNDSKLLISSGMNLKLVDVKTGETVLESEIPQPKVGDAFIPSKVAVSPDGRYLALAPPWGNRAIWLWDLRSLTPSPYQHGVIPPVISAAFSKNSERILCPHPDGGWVERDPASSEDGARRDQELKITQILTSSVNDSVIVSTADEVRLWNLNDDKASNGFPVEICDMQFMQGEREVYGRTLKIPIVPIILDVESGETRPIFVEKKRDSIRHVAFVLRAPSGEWITARHDATVLVDNTIVFAPENFSTLHLFPDGQRVALRDKQTVSIWDYRKCEEMLHFDCPPFYLSKMSNDGALIAIADDENGIHIWGTATGKKLASLTGHNVKITCLEFSANRSQILSGSADGNIRLWNIPTQLQSSVQ